jgi:hypothetical protein
MLRRKAIAGREPDVVVEDDGNVTVNIPSCAGSDSQGFKPSEAGRLLEMLYAPTRNLLSTGKCNAHQ